MKKWLKIHADAICIGSGWRGAAILNNLVPTVMLAMLSNMDFQAALTKGAVIGYMTRCMTKSGQGALIKVMEHSFSLCIEKARERQQGTGSAVLRWFNLQSISEVKSQLECMHLIFGAPRYMCSREFRHLYLRAETRQATTKETSSRKMPRMRGWLRSPRRSTTSPAQSGMCHRTCSF